MCGISGTVGLADREIITLMNQAMQHRGPDDSGVYVNSKNGVALGHVRLSIIETSRLGHQPMTYANQRYAITFNGEIYNYRELKLELEKLGSAFITNSDTEVVLAAYAMWGAECVEKLDGMFAFAIHDASLNNTTDSALFLARDRLGIKPLYYSIQNNIFCFSSEIKGLLGSGLVESKMDRHSLYHYQVQGSVHQPSTILENVSMLEAGHTMTVSGDLRLKLIRFWDIFKNSRGCVSDIEKMSEQDIHSQLRNLLVEATNRHMVADVQVGAFLSGGIDSSAVVGLMSRISGKPIKTYSIGYRSENQKTDELGWARIVSDHLSTDHTELIVTGKDVARCYSHIIAAIDQPSHDGSNTYLVSKLAGNEVKVALSGLGGDELFAGYPHYRTLARLDRWDSYSHWMGNSLKKGILKLAPDQLIADKTLALKNRFQRLISLRNLVSYGNLTKILSPEMGLHYSSEELLKYYHQQLNSDLTGVSSTRYYEINGYLIDTLLRDVDAAAMYSSLEVRPVLLDHQLAEFAFAIPGKSHIDSTVNKPVFVKAIKDLLPQEILEREKAGFELPLLEWLSGPLKERACDTFSSTHAAQVFSKTFLQSMVEILHQNRPVNLHGWSSLCLLEWTSINNCSI